MRALYRYGSDLIRSVGPKCPLPFDKIIFPRTAHLYPAYKHDNQTRNGFGLVCATVMHHSIGHVDFPKFYTGIFVEWKASSVFGEMLARLGGLPYHYKRVTGQGKSPF